MKGFKELVVVYPSSDQGVDGEVWVAHSLRTDQVGVGQDPVEAVRDLCFAVKTLLEEAESDKTVRVEQPAPIEILERYHGAQPMPDELWKRIQAAIQACIHHQDKEYWSDPEDSSADEWDDSAFYREILEKDLCLA